MTVQSTSSVSEWMEETYSKKEYFRPYQEDYTPLLTDLEECPDEPVYGKRWNVPLYMATAYNPRTGAEGGDGAVVQGDSVVQGQVYAQEFKNQVQLTELLTRQGKAGTHFNGGALNHQMKQATSDLTKHCQILLWGHGTGRLGVIDASGSSDTIRLRLPWAATRIRKNMRLSSYNTDTGGTAAWENQKVLTIDRTAKGDSSGAGYNTYGATIKIAASQTLTAGYGLYLSAGATGDDDYGYAPNGIDGLVGSATLAPTFLTQSRTTYPELNTNRLHNSGTPRDLTMDLMQQMSDMIWVNGTPIDAIRCNAGVMQSYANLLINDKRYPIAKGQYPTLLGGWKEGDLVFAYDTVQATLKKDPQCAARTMKFLSLKESFQKHTSAELGFLNRGGDILLPMPGGSGRGYAYSVTARLYAALNISCINPMSNGSLEDLKDNSLAGD